MFNSYVSNSSIIRFQEFRVVVDDNFNWLGSHDDINEYIIMVVKSTFYRIL